MIVKKNTIDSEGIWGDSNGFKLFISHLAKYKEDATTIKNNLDFFGISSFVAHDDITPGEKWEKEIKKALSTMDGLLALMHKGFHDSHWTNQEIGFALSKNIPIISLNRGCVPQGFIAQNQALSCNMNEAHLKISQILMNEKRMVDSYILCLKKCHSFEEANDLAELLPSIKNITKSQIQEIVAVFNENSQIRGSNEFCGCGNKKNKGLLFHLNRVTQEKFMISNTGKLQKNNE